MLCSHFAPFPNCFSSFFPLVAYHLCVPKRMSVPESLWYAQAAGSCVLQRKTRGATGSMPWSLHTLEFRHLMAFPTCQKGFTIKQKGRWRRRVHVFDRVLIYSCLLYCFFSSRCYINSMEGGLQSFWTASFLFLCCVIQASLHTGNFKNCSWIWCSFSTFPRKISINEQLKQTSVLFRVLTGALWVSVGSGEVKAQTEWMYLWGRNVLLDTLTKNERPRFLFPTSGFLKLQWTRHQAGFQIGLWN